MKVKIVCQRDYETKEVELPMNEESLLNIQGSVLERDTLGYIACLLYTSPSPRFKGVYLKEIH